ncbi:MAG TPA: hypothetical protein VGV93_08270 [Acidimicrobiales bacterium]|nr:hypothetical protein [Acidimicrobiales bacterium]
MRRLVALSALGSMALWGGSVTAASADPRLTTRGCQTVAMKFLDPTAPGHQGVATAAMHGTGEGPCGFGSPPGH